MAADAGSVVWVGDLGPRVTDAALRGVFSQFGDVADARLVRDSFTHRPTGCGWVRFRDAERAAAVVRRCNVTALYIVAGSPRPVRLGATLAEVMLDCWAAPAPGAPQDELRAAAASQGLAEGAPCAGKPRYELVVDCQALKDKRAAQAHAEQRTAMEQHRADRDSFLEVCTAEQSKLFATHKQAVETEQDKLQRMESMAKQCPDLGMRRGGR